MDDREIIGLLLDRDESALTLISEKYSSLCRGMLRGILKDERDVDECMNDVLLGVWNSIPPNRPENLGAYVCKLARRSGISRLRHNTASKRSSDSLVLMSELDECMPREMPSDEGACESAISVIDRFLRGLDISSRVLFIRRYIYFEPLSSLAERFGISENGIAVKLFRIRKKLQKILQKEGIWL